LVYYKEICNDAQSHKRQIIAALCGVLKAFMIQETFVMVYNGFFHLIMDYGNILGDILHIVKIFSGYKKIELQQVIGIEYPVETYLKD
jgi:hypothetical protein